MRKNAKHIIMDILNNGNLTSAYMIARTTGYSPQHINRCLRDLFQDGRVAYALVPHRKQRQMKRLWCGMKDAEFFSKHYPVETPEYIQEELI